MVKAVWGEVRGRVGWLMIIVWIPGNILEIKLDGGNGIKGSFNIYTIGF